MFGIQLIFAVFATLDKVDFSNISWINLYMLDMTSVISSFSGLAIGIFLYYNAEKLDLDKWTWLLIGLVYQHYSLVFILILLIFKSHNKQIDLIKSIQTVLFLLLVIYLINSIAIPFWIKHSGTTNKDVVSIKFAAHIKVATSSMPIIFNFCKYLLNVVFAVKVNTCIRDYSCTKKHLGSCQH